MKGKPAAEILSDLRLRPTGLPAVDGEAAFAGASVGDGWYLIVVPGVDHEMLSPAVLERLSVGCEVLTCAVEEHVMFSEATGWENGERLWAVSHTGEDGPVGIAEDGTLPLEYSSIRARLSEQQAAEGGPNADVDYLFDIPVELVQTFVGYRHDQVAPGGAPNFESLESELPPKPRSWVRRLLG